MWAFLGAAMRREEKVSPAKHSEETAHWVKTPTGSHYRQRCYETATHKPQAKNYMQEGRTLKNPRTIFGTIQGELVSMLGGGWGGRLSFDKTPRTVQGKEKIEGSCEKKRQG